MPPPRPIRSARRRLSRADRERLGDAFDGLLAALEALDSPSGRCDVQVRVLVDGYELHIGPPAVVIEPPR